MPCDRVALEGVAQRRQAQHRQQGDDGHRHEEFDQREAAGPGLVLHGCMLGTHLAPAYAQPMNVRSRVTNGYRQQARKAIVRTI